MQDERGGRTVYGQPLGIMMLDTTFPRPWGDIGNARTWPFPVVYRVVHGALPHRVLGTDLELLASFMHAAKELEAVGVQAVTTSCGYLAMFQRELAAAVHVPVLTSSLLQVPLAHQLIGRDRKVGILTIRDMLTEQHFDGVGWSSDTVPVVVGVLPERSKFTRRHAPMGEPEDIEATPEELRNEVVEAASRLASSDSAIGAIVMECTNLVPYSQAVREATGLAVLDHYTLVMNAYRGVAGSAFPAW